MTPFEQFFDGNIYVINMARRPDRLEHFAKEMKLIGVTCWQRFEAIDAGPDDGNRGCTASHRALLDMAVKRGFRRMFIFEDDATVRDPFRGSFNEEVDPILREIPPDYQMIYLGGGYGSNPREWYSRHLILMGQMKTTSSYGVTLESARELRDIIPTDTCDSIDNLYAGYNESKRCYISEPRFFVQYNNYSDLQKRPMNNTPSMEDRGHVDWLGNIGRKGAKAPPPKPAPEPPPPPPPLPVIKEPEPVITAVPIPAEQKPAVTWSGRVIRSRILP